MDRSTPLNVTLAISFFPKEDILEKGDFSKTVADFEGEGTWFFGAAKRRFWPKKIFKKCFCC
jgi:hypothetical protein